MFPKPAVAEVLQNYIEARIHADHADAKLRTEARALQDRFVGSIATPSYVVVDPKTEKGKKLGLHQLTDVIKGLDVVEQKFIEFLKRHQ